MKNLLIVLLVLTMILSGCSSENIKNNNADIANGHNQISKLNNTCIKWKLAFYDNHVSLENLKIFKSEDGGKSWTEINIPVSTLSKDIYSDNY